MLIDVTEQKLLQKQLEQLAFYDGLTQIYNRTQFILRSRELLKEVKKQGNSVSIILFDIDYFKHINDTYGHEAGDRLIVHVVSVCQRLLSTDMLFARYGGEEFVLALPSTTLQEASELAERIRSSMENEPLAIHNVQITVTASFGVSETTGYDDALEALLRDADAALYTSKRNGRNRISLYEGHSNRTGL
jgi:diguanylate cyclase (GGDEF)-like protein